MNVPAFFMAREPVKNMGRSEIFFTINHPLCGCETKAYSKKTFLESDTIRLFKSIASG